ncbi:hypothetical protein E1I21_10790 [Microbacterium oleivorans]|uniref:Putative glycosyl hydrolase n=1 Tax=Microbacterium oleivorans TaxID=273677 RepID=A0A031FPD5_9MICO|nr:hypothetical protein [Microbacterium oleivorans]AZS43654.1 hypothetical protein BWL13_01218 [Microbacterium oleivorans]AZS44703.1 hypothetical protein BWL13_02297 [Microbacterium oleivorans]EZP26147.1 putative glycosyl hydrolase [Microbacterium oleivorans]THE06721.1 hypothetical protein E1I21_10790 [Microbacterium oleivorans]
MVFHSKATLEHWVAEFIDARSAGEEIRVAVQDGSGGEDTGLVLIPLESAPNEVWIEPRDEGDDLSWHVFIQPAEQTLELTSFELNALTHELQIAAELCAFLQEKSLGHSEPEPAAESESESSSAE